MKKIMQTPVLVTRTFRHTDLIATSSDVRSIHGEIDMSQEAQDAAAKKNGGNAVPAYGIQW